MAFRLSAPPPIQPWSPRSITRTGSQGTAPPRCWENTGYVDGLVTRTLDDTSQPHFGELDLLRRVFEAGGPDLRESALARAGRPEARQRLERLLRDDDAVTEAS